MSEPKFLLHPETTFPIGVEYYRGPVPKRAVWDDDFARIRASGLRIVRSFSYWNHMEPAPGQYQLDDFDLMFDLAAKHGLYVWLDLTLATHGACPEWLTREYPDIRAVDQHGQPSVAAGSAACPQGSMLHCYDHPVWQEYGGGLLRHVVDRYKDRPNLLVWGLWDGVSPISAGSEGLPCYCPHSLAAYKAWLQARFSLAQFNERALRRYHTWEDVEPPRHQHNIVEMLLFKRFVYENLVDKLKWMVAETRALDPDHEIRAHGVVTPQPWNEACAREVDSWGMSMSSNNVLTGPDADGLVERAFGFDAARALAAKGRWWNEEIYAGMARGGVTWKKQSDPRELTALLWLTIAGGAAGCMFWQYRPEYLSFESPGYNLVALDGQPTARLEAVSRAIAQVDGMQDYLPVECGRAEIGIVYHPPSQELFGYNGETQRYNADLKGVYRTLWSHGLSADLLTPAMDWSDYRLLFLPNVALMDDATRERIEQTLAQSPQTRLVAEGSFGLYAADGQSSYAPPEGFGERFGVRVADFSAVTSFDIEEGRNVLATPLGAVPIRSSCGYAVLEPLGDTQAWAALGEETVAVRSADGVFTWLGLTLSAGFGDQGVPELVLGLVEEAGIRAPLRVVGGEVVPIVRPARPGGWLVFLFNMGREIVDARVESDWALRQAEDLLAHRPLPLADHGGGFSLAIDSWEMAVVHCVEEEVE